MQRIMLILLLLFAALNYECSAQVKISEMTADTNIDSSDTFVIVDHTTGSWLNRKVTWDQLRKNLGFDVNGKLTYQSFPSMLGLTNRGINIYSGYLNVMDPATMILPSNTVTWDNLTTAAQNLINLTGGSGTIVNNPDDITLQTTADSTIEIKQTYTDQFYKTNEVLEVDSVIHSNKGIRVGPSGSLIDSIKVTDALDEIRIYYNPGNEDSISFFSVAGDSLEPWCKDMRFKAPTSLPVDSSLGGTPYFSSIPNQNTLYYVNSSTGIDTLQYFSDPNTGVRHLWFASYLINVDSSGVHPVDHGEFENVDSITAYWTDATATTQKTLSSDYMVGLYHPTSLHSLEMTSTNPTTTKPYGVSQQIQMIGGKTYRWKFLSKQTGTFTGLNQMTIIDDITGFKYLDEDLITGAGDGLWTIHGGEVYDTVTTSFQILVREDRQFNFNDAINWQEAGFYTIEAEKEAVYKGDYSGKVTAVGSGDSTSNNVYVSAGMSNLIAGLTFTVSGWYLFDDEVVGDATDITIKLGQFIHTESVVRGTWTYFEFSGLVTAYTIGKPLKVYCNGDDIFYLDEFSVLHDGGDRTVTVKFTGNAIQNAGNTYIDNFEFTELSASSIGWFNNGKALILDGTFENDSLYIDGQFSKGTPQDKVVITSKPGKTAQIKGNWNVTNGIKLYNQTYGYAISDLYLEKFNRSGVVMVSEDRGIIQGSISRLWIDSTGYYNHTLHIGSPPSVTGSYMGIDIRGNYTVLDNLRVTNAMNDGISIYGEHHKVTNCDLLCGWNAGNGDGFQFKMSNYMTIIGNTIKSMRYDKLSRGETIPDTLGGNNYDNKSAILLNRQGEALGSSYDTVAYNHTYGFSNGIAGNGGINNYIHNNWINSTKQNILSGTPAGGTGIALFGSDTFVFNNLLQYCWEGMYNKLLDDSLYVFNNTVLQFRETGLRTKATTSGQELQYFNNVFYTDTTGTTIVDMPTVYVPTVMDYNLYYSPENTFDYHGYVNFSDIQLNTTYETNSFSERPLLTPVMKTPDLLSPLLDAGMAMPGGVNYDFYDKTITGTPDIGAVNR